MSGERLKIAPGFVFLRCDECGSHEHSYDTLRLGQQCAHCHGWMRLALSVTCYSQHREAIAAIESLVSHLSSEFEDAMIAWCDGGPYPTEAIKRHYEETKGVKFGVAP